MQSNTSKRPALFYGEQSAEKASLILVGAFLTALAAGTFVLLQMSLVYLEQGAPIFAVYLFCATVLFLTVVGQIYGEFRWFWLGLTLVLHIMAFVYLRKALFVSLGADLTLLVLHGIGYTLLVLTLKRILMLSRK